MQHFVPCNKWHCWFHLFHGDVIFDNMNTMIDFCLTWLAIYDNVCFLFICVPGNSTLSTSILSDIWDNIQNLDWPWWVAMGFIVAMLVLMACCIKLACKAKRRKQSKVDVKETENVGHNKQKIEVGHNTVKDKVKLKKRSNLRHIQVESLHQHQQRI